MTRCGRQRPESRAAIEPCAEPKRRRARNEAGQRRQDEAGGSGCQPEAKRKNMMPRDESRAHLQQAYEANQRRLSTAEAHEAKQRRRWHDEESSGS